MLKLWLCSVVSEIYNQMITSSKKIEFICVPFLGFQGCSEYFPSDAGENQTHGSFNVNCQSITVDWHSDFVERELQLSMTDDPSTSKELTHLQFKTWPDCGVPDGPTIAGFIDHVRQTVIKT